MKRLNETIKFIFAALYLVYLKLFAEKPRLVVIYYHGVGKEDIPNFRKQMEYLAKKCTVVKPSNIMTADTSRTNHVVAITLDDAFLDVMQNAIPILEMYGLPAGIFIPAGNLGQPARWETPEGSSENNAVVMSEEQILKLDKGGFEIFSHSVSHPILTEITGDRLQAELEKSKYILEEIVGHEVVGISYPYGAYNDEVCRLAERIGYRIGFSIEPCLVDGSSDILQMGRFKVSPKDSMLKFKLKVSGAYEVVKYFGRLKRILFIPWRSNKKR